MIIERNTPPAILRARKLPPRQKWAPKPLTMKSVIEKAKHPAELFKSFRWKRQETSNGA